MRNNPSSEEETHLFRSSSTTPTTVAAKAAASGGSVLRPLLLLLVLAGVVYGMYRAATDYRFRNWLANGLPVLRQRRLYLSPSKLIQRCAVCAMTKQDLNVSGHVTLPTPIQVGLHPADVSRLGGHLDWAAQQVTSAVVRRSRKQSWDIAPDFSVHLVTDRYAVEGHPQMLTRDVSLGWTPSTAKTDEMDGSGGGRTRRATSFSSPKTVQPPTQLFVSVELIPLDGGEEIALCDFGARVTIGREGCDVNLPVDYVSAHHAELVHRGEQWVIIDYGSTNGTWVNGKKVNEQALVHADELRFAPNGPRYIFSRPGRDREKIEGQ